MYFAQELLDIKEKVKSVAFKRSLYCVKGTKEPIYVLKLLGHDGFFVESAYGMGIDVLESEIDEALDFLKDNGFEIDSHSIIS